MTKRTLRIALEVFAGLIAGMVILGGFGIWRLTSGPISLDYLTVTIEDTLNSQQDIVRVDIDDTVLTWGGWSRAIDVVAQDVFVSQLNGTRIAHFPEISLGLSLRALTQGVIAPTSLELRAPELSITRYHDGRFGLDFTPADADDEIALQDEVNTIYQTLLQRPGEGGMLGYLARVSIEEARLTFRDKTKDSLWYSPETSLIFERDKERFTGNVKSKLLLEGNSVDFSIGGTHQYGDDRLYLLANLDGLPPSMLLQMAPALEGFVGGERAISGSMELALDEKARIRGADALIFSDYGEVIGNLLIGENGDDAELELQVNDFDFSELADGAKELVILKALEAKINAKLIAKGNLSGDVKEASLNIDFGNGFISLPDLYDEKLPLKSASFDIYGADNFAKLDITKGRIDTGEGLITLGAQTRREEVGRKVKLSANLTDFQMRNLHKYWPESMGMDARNWVIPNMPKGNIQEATADMIGTLSFDGKLQFDLEDMGGKIVGREMVVDYLSPMPKATGGVAAAEYGPNWLQIYIDEGAVGNILLDRGHVAITGIGTTDDISVDLDLAGPVDELLLNVDRKPLTFLDDLEFDRAGVTGDAKLKVKLEFPLLNSLTAEMVKARADVEMSNLFLPEVYGGLSGTSDKLILGVDNDGMDVAGIVEMIDGPMDVSWRENFEEAEPIQSHFTVKGKLSGETLASLGLDAGEYSKGFYDIDLVADEYREGQVEIDVAVGLDKAMVSVPLLSWEKSLDEVGYLTLKATIKPDGIISILPISVVTSSLIFDGDVTLGEAGKQFSALHINRLEIGENSATGSVVRNDQGRFVVRMSGPRFDVAGLTGSDDEEQDKPDTEKDRELALDIIADFDVITDGPEGQLKDVTFDLVYENAAIQVFNLNSIAGNSPFTINYVPTKFGGYSLNIRSTDAGAVMDQLDVSGRIGGGDMVITGTRAHQDSPIYGVASVKDFTLLEAPSVAKILEFMSLTGIASALGQTGLPFTNLDAEFSYDDGVVDIVKGLAFGSSIGITTEGKIDVDNEEYALKGTVAPVYSLSRAVSWIPVLGNLLSGDEGIFAARYTIGGTMEDPDVSVNPISALTPGILRNIFNVFGDEETLSRDADKKEEVDQNPTSPSNNNTHVNDN